jgi:hypothetical protein
MIISRFILNLRGEFYRSSSTTDASTLRFETVMFMGDMIHSSEFRSYDDKEENHQATRLYNDPFESYGSGEL